MYVCNVRVNFLKPEDTLIKKKEKEKKNAPGVKNKFSDSLIYSANRINLTVCFL